MQELMQNVPEKYRRQIALAYWAGAMDGAKSEKKEPPKPPQRTHDCNIMSLENFLKRKVGVQF